MKLDKGTRFALQPLALAVLAVFAAPASAATDAGAILQQMKPDMAPAPAPAKPGLTVERPAGAALPVSMPFVVRSIRIEGNTLIDTATLAALVADAEGQTLRLDQLGKWVARITDLYHRRGYSLSRAIVPAQKIENGELTIEVIEARYGEVALDNRSRVEDALLEDILNKLKSGQVIEQQAMDHALLLLSDVPGTQIKATLKPGAATGTSDLGVAVDTGANFTGKVVADNFGNRYIGRSRLGATFNFYNPLHHGDVLTLGAVTTGDGMTYGRAAYDWLLNGGRDTHLGGGYTAVSYVLGDTLAPLNGHGVADVASLWGKQAFARSRDFDLYGMLQYDHKQLRDRIDVSSIRTDRTLNNWVFSLSGDSRDGALAGAVNGWNVGVTSGVVGFDDAAAEAADAASANTQGGYAKVTASISRLQSLTASDMLDMSLSGQWASTNLDSSEKMSMGGPNTVRAYDMGVVSGDEGYFASLEYRHSFGVDGAFQSLLFLDGANVTVNRDPWGAGDNSASLYGWGVGLNWSVARFKVKACVANRIGPAPEMVTAAADTRGWLELSTDF